MKDRKTIYHLGVCALALSLFSAPAAALQFGDWDTDNEAGLTSDEYRAGFEATGTFDDWDANDDDMLSREELDQGIGENEQAFSARFGSDPIADWDADGDEALSEDEFYEGTYSVYDADDNDVIEEPEFGDLGDDMGDQGFWDV